MGNAAEDLWCTTFLHVRLSFAPRRRVAADSCRLLTMAPAKASEVSENSGLGVRIRRNRHPDLDCNGIGSATSGTQDGC